ncbi:YoaK family protein [Dyella nitratireducens]|uniref:Membrane protein n=1 Tax=Dyella nitratireducens TaxID=1849580 RepID=A0ABQ1GE51_9GAMM|nr:YoaK family protein [Dyella nitratireducens]GGA42020.1 membrane protein [Dyella nitratireducens]GLQ42062.1 membrane protein [Dyella nitratireducens]
MFKMPNLPTLLSFNAGYVDSAGFLALHGLFTTHVTGNFVTLGAAFVYGSSGTVAKLLALPVFCIVIVFARLLHYKLVALGRPVLRTLFLLELVLLIVGAWLAWVLGPFPDADNTATVVVGMIFVTAMALQNAVHRVHLSYAPPSTIMTGTTTQIMLDLADKLHGGLSEEQASALNSRLVRFSGNVAVFALGCGCGALMFAIVSVKCFTLLPIVAALAYVHNEAKTES